jgi:hypothetical protein
VEQYRCAALNAIRAGQFLFPTYIIGSSPQCLISLSQIVLFNFNVCRQCDP